MELEEILGRIHQKKLYYADNSELVESQMERLDMLYEYNHTKPSEQEKKQALLKKMFKSLGEGCYIETPFSANWAGKNVTIGDHFYANFNLVLVDDGEITIGDDVMIAPGVIICSGTHPVSPRLRRKQAQYNVPVKIGNNVWIGAGSVIMPGVTIGDNTVIGAGSVVTKDIPGNVVAHGNPCRVAREITERDEVFYQRDLEIDID